MVNEYDLLSIEMLGTTLIQPLFIQKWNISNANTTLCVEHSCWTEIFKMYIDNNALRVRKNRQFSVERLETALEEIGAVRGVQQTNVG